MFPIIDICCSLSVPHPLLQKIKLRITATKPPMIIALMAHFLAFWSDFSTASMISLLSLLAGSQAAMLSSYFLLPFFLGGGFTPRCMPSHSVFVWLLM
jgi:hypothetical protein